MEKRMNTRRVAMVMCSIRFLLGGLVILATLTSLFRPFYSAGFFMRDEEICRQFYGVRDSHSTGFDTKDLSNRVEEVLFKMASLQDKLELAAQEMGKGGKAKLEYKKFLEEEVIPPLYSAHISLRQIRLPKARESTGNATAVEDPLINSFAAEEIRKYLTARTDTFHNTIGHACVLMKDELEEYMTYDIGSYCKDDWPLAQKLMLSGCDPLPRRRCLARASKLYLKPHAVNESLWRLPDGRNVRWANYECRNFECLAAKNPKRGYSECSGCFEMDKEKVKWMENNSTLPAGFSISDVLEIKPGEIRIGLDFGIGTGTFAARMKERNVTIISTALNLGAPFNEMIALRGLLPLYATLNQRLPFFDNTMDLIHTVGFLDGWIDLQLMDFILFDWDRVLRPGGLLWVDHLFCKKTELDDLMYMFLQFRYKKHKWVIAPKSKDEVYLSALLEKTPRSP